MIEYLNNIDTTIFLAINGAHSTFFDSFMTMFTGRYIWIPMYLMALVVLFVRCRWQTALAYLVALATAIILTDQLCASIIRPAVERLRPSNIENALSDYTYIVGGYRGGSYGFPSCHAANSFALAIFMALFVKRRTFTIFIFGWAILNSYSRLYLGVHYPGDLMAGALIGTTLGGVCYTGMRSLTRYIGARYPALASAATHHGNSVSLTQLSPGSSLTTLTPSASLMQQLNGVTIYRIVSSDLMIATFAITLAVIIISAALS